MPATASLRPIEFRNTTLGAHLAVIQAAEPSTLADALHKMLGGMPDFFSGEALILDFGALAHTPERIDWAGLQSLLRRYRLQLIGAIHLPEAQHESARRAGLALIDPSQLVARAPMEAPHAATAPASTTSGAEAAAHPTPTLFVDRPLRSGQQVYARGTDLVLLGGVSPGAEVIADGSIHCYGPLRGRAIAGARGDPAARILASHFGPELVSIAGVYRTFEHGIQEAFAGKPTLVRFDGTDHTLSLDALKLD